MKRVPTFNNVSGLEFVDISGEQWREYIFPGGQSIRIERPLQLHVSDGGHRVFDADGISHYVPKSWIHLRWKAEEGTPHFRL